MYISVRGSLEGDREGGTEGAEDHRGGIELAHGERAIRAERVEACVSGTNGANRVDGVRARADGKGSRAWHRDSAE